MNIKKTGKIITIISAGAALVTSLLTDKRKKENKKH